MFNNKNKKALKLADILNYQLFFPGIEIYNSNNNELLARCADPYDYFLAKKDFGNYKIKHIYSGYEHNTRFRSFVRIYAEN